MNFQLNVIIAATLYSSGMNKRDTRYLRCLCECVVENKVEVNRIFLDRMAADVERVKKAVIEAVCRTLLSYLDYIYAWS
jgi:hypothetical protein